MYRIDLHKIFNNIMKINEIYVSFIDKNLKNELTTLNSLSI